MTDTLKPEDILPGMPSDYYDMEVLSEVGFLDKRMNKLMQPVAVGLCGWVGEHNGVEFRSWPSHDDDSDGFIIVFRCKTGIIAGAVEFREHDTRVGLSGFSTTKKKGRRKLSHSARDAFRAFAADAVEALEKFVEERDAEKSA